MKESLYLRRIGESFVHQIFVVFPRGYLPNLGRLKHYNELRKKRIDANIHSEFLYVGDRPKLHEKITLIFLAKIGKNISDILRTTRVLL